MGGIFIHPTRIRSFTGAGRGGDQTLYIKADSVTLSSAGELSFVPVVQSKISEGLLSVGSPGSVSSAVESASSYYSSGWITPPPGISGVSVNFSITALDWAQTITDPNDPLDAGGAKVYYMNCSAALYMKRNGTETRVALKTKQLGIPPSGGGYMGATIYLSRDSYSSYLSYTTGFDTDDQAAFEVRLSKTRGTLISELIGTANKSPYWSASSSALTCGVPESLSDIDANVSFVVIE